MLTACEESTTLSKALSGLTDTIENVSAIWGKQAEADNAKLIRLFVQTVIFYSPGCPSLFLNISH